MDPKVSICIPTYNRPILLKKLLKSIENQSYTNYQVIITDNSDTNDTKIMLEENFPKLNINYKKNKSNIGMDGNAVESLSLATGEYFTFTADDDVWIDIHKLELQVAFMEMNRKINASFSGATEIKRDGTYNDTIYKCEGALNFKVIASSDLKLGHAANRFVNVLTGLFRSCPLKQVFLKSWQLGSEEYGMWYIGYTNTSIGYSAKKMVGIRESDHLWEISDKAGGLINYSHDNEFSALRTIRNYVCLKQDYPEIRIDSTGRCFLAKYIIGLGGIRIVYKTNYITLFAPYSIGLLIHSLYKTIVYRFRKLFSRF